MGEFGACLLGLKELQTSIVAPERLATKTRKEALKAGIRTVGQRAPSGRMISQEGTEGAEVGEEPRNTNRTKVGASDFTADSTDGRGYKELRRPESFEFWVNTQRPDFSAFRVIRVFRG